MQNMFKGNVSMQDTHTQIMSSCKTLQFRKTCLLSLVGRHDLLKDMSSCLKMHFYCFYFLCFILLKTCLFPRHVLIWHQDTIFTVYVITSPANSTIATIAMINYIGVSSNLERMQDYSIWFGHCQTRSLLVWETISIVGREQLVSDEYAQIIF